ncbi:NADH-quinone oxidoreductase subunit C [Candidatus Auribacterota bacterium]
MDQLKLDELKKFFAHITEGEIKGSYIVPKKDIFAFCKYLIATGDLSFDYLKCLTAVDYNDRVEIVYELYSFRLNVSVTLKVSLANDDLKIDSVTPLWDAADWMEREVYDLFGVCFDKHPDLRRILCADNWKGHPLRKNYENKEMIKKT